MLAQLNLFLLRPLKPSDCNLSTRSGAPFNPLLSIAFQRAFWLTPTVLPIEPLKDAALKAVRDQPLVIAAPTGSGKSTQVPLWCAESFGRVLVVEPRRVACRSLARFVTGKTGSELGKRVGYAVRHDHRFEEQSEIVYATPGTILRLIKSPDQFLSQWNVLIIDEFHERQLDMDLLVAMALRAEFPQLIVMSATVDAEQLANSIGGSALIGEGKLFPVDVGYAGESALPSRDELASRVEQAVESVLERPGDILVFLPGKGEISSCASALRGLVAHSDLEVIPLHGGLTSKEQDRAFDPGAMRRVILATNVAETSVTLPRIGVVIDSGLERQTRYHWGRSVLRLTPISVSSAEQRRGRAGRLGPGFCLRLWGRLANLAEAPLPEILREPLADATLQAARCGFKLSDLPLVDRPPRHTIESADTELRRLGCIDDRGTVTEVGQATGRLPLSVRDARIMVAAAEQADTAGSSLLHDTIDLMAAIQGRSFLLPIQEQPSDERAKWRDTRCDATQLILAMRNGDPARDGLHRNGLAEARRVATQLRSLLGISGEPPKRVHRENLVKAWIAGDLASAFARRRKRDAYSNDGTEVTLGRESILKDDIEAIIAVQLHARQDRQRVRSLATVAIPTSLRALATLGVGSKTVDRVSVVKGVLNCFVKRTLAGRTLETSQEVPEGEAAVAALLMGIKQGTLFRKAVSESNDLIAHWNLFRRLEKHQSEPAVDGQRWLEERCSCLGFGHGEDLPLLSPGDFAFQPPLVFDLGAQDRMRRKYPLKVSVSEAHYDVTYDFPKRTVTLHWKAGAKRRDPALPHLPAWSGWKVRVKRGSNVKFLR